jgi:hypothetical protein
VGEIWNMRTISGMEEEPMGRRWKTERGTAWPGPEWVRESVTDGPYVTQIVRIILK